MRKIFSLLSILALSFTFAYAEEPMNFDSQNINSEFDQINKIEKYVQANDGVTLSQLKSENSELLKGIDMEAQTMSTVSAGELPAGIPAFWWGCILTVVGVILVYVLTDSDKDQTKKALMGCLVTGGVWLLWWVIVVVAGVGGSAYWWF